jgi:hypothetical protein
VKKTHLATPLVFVMLVFGLMMLDVSKEPAEISIGERRKLAQRPELSAERVLNGEFAKDYSLFLQDQIEFRDGFRNLKSLVERRVFRKRENNGVYIVDDNIYDKFYGINDRYLRRAAGLINQIADSIHSSRVYLSVIPSKAHMLDGDEYLLSDQTIVADTLEQNTNAKYIDIMHLFEEAREDLYYRTDHHWTTQGAIQAYEVLVRAMGYEPITDYTFEEVTDSYVGSLYGRAAVNSIPKDSIHLAHNEWLDGMTVCRYETLDAFECFASVYFREKAGGLDPYDVFVGGAGPITIVENRSAPVDEELAVFKDSYAHVLAPLLAQHFRRVMLFDLRYVRKELILDQLNLDESVVLFLYSTIILNTEPQILN